MIDAFQVKNDRPDFEIRGMLPVPEWNGPLPGRAHHLPPRYFPCPWIAML